jgi:hypothetical protein
MPALLVLALLSVGAAAQSPPAGHEPASPPTHMHEMEVPALAAAGTGGAVQGPGSGGGSASTGSGGLPSVSAGQPTSSLPATVREAPRLMTGSTAELEYLWSATMGGAAEVFYAYANETGECQWLLELWRGAGRTPAPGPARAGRIKLPVPGRWWAGRWATAGFTVTAASMPVP